jgi:integrase/recombinase XerD
MRHRVEEFLVWLASTNHAVATVRNHRTGLTRFLAWCTARIIVDLIAITPTAIEEYRMALYAARRENGSTLGWATQGEYLGTVRNFLRWCHRRGLIPGDPGAELVLPRRPFRLPLGILNAAEVELVLRQADHRTIIGLRDRAMLELFYSTGLRRAEVAHLRVADVWAGKGQRDRVTPIGRRAIRWTVRYIRRSRPRLVRQVDPGILFLTARGGGFGLNRLSERVSGYFAKAGFAHRGSCHLFRHTAATLLLEGGADIREVQEILGHRNLTTTARYTHLSIARLQIVHASAHPAERKRGAAGRQRRRGWR